MSFSFSHVQGELVKYESRVWRVGLVQHGRMRLDPLTGYAQVAIASGRSFQSYGSSVNIAPTSWLEQVAEGELSPTENDRLIRLMEREIEAEAQSAQEAEMAVAAGAGAVATPVGAPPAGSKKAINDKRKADLEAKKAAAKAAAPPKKEPKQPKPCKCGCGAQTGGYFVPGHDAKFKSWLLQIERGQKKPEELLTEAVRQSYKWKKTADGKGLMPTTNYKGEPHNGYEAA